MTSRRVTPLLLAASIFLTGATGAFIGSATSAQAITSVDELTDVNHNHWAYDALRDLVEKYDVIEGYPDHTFRGERTATRWELAAALNALIKSVGRDLARLGAEKADKADLETLAKLQDEFKNELAALQARTDALESRASAIEAKNAEQDQRLSLLERTQIHGDASFGGFADMGSQGTRGAFSSGAGKDGIRDAISAVGRVRLTMDIPVKEDKEDSKVGAGEFHTRMIAAFGRLSPNGANPNNAGAFNSFNSISRIASDAALANEGLNASSLNAGLNGGVNLRSSLYVENMHYHQHFKSGIPLLTDWMVGSARNDKAWATTGDMYAGQLPWRYLFDKSPYRGNEQNQFQNSAFVNTAGVALNFNMPMIAYQWHQKLGSDNLSADLTGGLGSVSAGNALNGLNATYEGRLNYNLASHAGNLYAGGYNIWNDGNGNFNANTIVANTGTTATVNRSGQPGGSQRNVTNGVYAGWNQEWFRGIGTTFNYLYNNKGASNFWLNANNQLLGSGTATTQLAPGSTLAAGVAAGTLNRITALGVKQTISGVLSVPMKVFGIRENDTFGIGYAVISLYNDNMGTGVQTSRFKNTWEQTGEVYYKYAINDAISIIPSFQIISNSLGVQNNGLTYVVGLRTSYSF